MQWIRIHFFMALLGALQRYHGFTYGCNQQRNRKQAALDSFSEITSNENKELFSQLQINTEFIEGIVKRNSAMNLEINAKAHLELNDDTSTAGKRISIEGNLVFIRTELDHSERLKGKKIHPWASGGRRRKYINRKKISDEKQDKLSANGILRLRITKDLWLPVEIKYEPVTGNVFGLLNLTTNFDWLNN